MKQLLSTSASLAFPKEGATLCLLTDASDAGWSVIISQVAQWQPHKAVHEQQYELLTCLSGTFTGSQCNWSITEKEAYPIVCACDKLSYLLLRPGGLQLYCDHRNLIYVFAPGKEVKKHIRGKLLRWSTKLMEYRYEVEHLDGNSNVWADMVSRWAGNHDPSVRLNMMQLRKRTRQETEDPGQRPKRRRCSKNKAAAPTTHAERSQRRLVQQLRPVDDPEFEWPTLAAVCVVQQQHSVERPRHATRDDDNGWFVENKLWIPSKAQSLIQRLLVVAHCGSQAHRGREAMIESVGRHFNVQQLRSRVEQFLAACLMCKHVKGAKIL
ncbi:hypothetical protein PC110_g7144 [Phytophthora cactorum]|uniref:Reverse transcriptase RNase H-like domain-containing protein n=1 Tax=Phytophthora cactorum TaxID=29920 RepID=A0A329SIE2_9STRA|nr:hypothetical protein PC110_g7144 [Phytophthora cactorum]